MPRIILIKKSYHDHRGRPSPIGNVSKSFTSGWIVPIRNDDGGPFHEGGNGPLGGGDNGPPKGGGSGHLANQNPRSYVVRPARLRIRPTWNPWYPSWYHVQPPITPNPSLK